MSSKGDIKCIITGKMRKETPEERVRQEFCRMLLRVYKYPKDNIDIEFPIKMGRATKWADIVVYNSPVKSQGNAYIVIETKKEKEAEGVEQALSYMSASSAEFAVWTNGTGIKYYQKGAKGKPDHDLPDIPKFRESLDDIGTYEKANLDPCTDLRGIFAKCNNYFYVNQGLTPDRRFSEILKLIFVKIEDEKNLLSPCLFRITPKDRETEAGLGRCRERIEKLYTAVRDRYKRDKIFEETDTIKLNDRCLAFAVAELQKYDLLRTDLDVKGVAFETFVGVNLRGEHGEFFTPREVVKMAVEMVNPQPNEVVLDPACGSGGFLIYTLKHVRGLMGQLSRPEQVDQLNREYAERFIRGVDFNPDLARVAKMNMVLNGDGHTGIFHSDSLMPLDQWDKELSDKVPPGKVDIILTNPPFGEKCKVDDKRILAHFDLGHHWRYDSKSDAWIKTSEIENATVPDILFIERCLELLRPGGRMAIVLPDGILGNKKSGYVRQYILDRAYVLGIVDCPVETFLPSVDTKTSVMILKRKADKDYHQTFDAFMAIARMCGHDRRGKLIYKRDSNGNAVVDTAGDPIVDNDFVEIAEEFKQYAQSKDLLS